MVDKAFTGACKLLRLQRIDRVVGNVEGSLFCGELQQSDEAWVTPGQVNVLLALEVSCKYFAGCGTPEVLVHAPHQRRESGYQLKLHGLEYDRGKLLCKHFRVLTKQLSTGAIMDWFCSGRVCPGCFASSSIISCMRQSVTGTRIEL